ncbi:MAG: metal-dependent transcriptional regulator [Aggregatilineales bacterium]
MTQLAQDDLNSRMRSYLAEVYRLAERDGTLEAGYVSTSALAELLFVSAPAVNRMVNRLKEIDYLEHEPYQGIRLTDTGRHEALLQLRQHRITEAFLVEVMGFGWDEIFHEAQRMSHTLTPPILERMYEMAGQPTVCPHGEAIPATDGSVTSPDDDLLTQTDAGQTVIISRILTREADRLQYLEALTLRPGTEFEILHVAPFNGPLQLKIQNEYRIVGYNLAQLIRVKPA